MPLGNRVTCRLRGVESAALSEVGFLLINLGRLEPNVLVYPSLI